MHLFSRSTTARPERIFDAMAFATDIAKHVTKVTGLEVSTWSTVYGQPVGSIGWSARVDSVAAMGAATATLLADATYVGRVAEAAELFAGPTEDSITQFVATAGPGNPVGDVVSLVRTQCAPGKIAAAMAWAVDMIQHLAKITGSDVSLVRSLFGPWASLGFIASAGSLDALDAANAAMAADATYVAKLDEAGPLFLPGATHQVLLQRLG